MSDDTPPPASTSREPQSAPLGRLGAWLIRVWLRIVGRRIPKADVPWLRGEIGPSGPIGEHFYELLAEREGLQVETNRPGSGLLDDFDALASPDFEPARVHSEVRRFYENTSDYSLDVWSETRFPGRLFLWLLVMTVSRYMNQLNFPVFGLETSRGMTSEIVELVDEDGQAHHKGWFRRIISENRVIYTGFYMLAHVPSGDTPCVKVVFPLPRGNATVLLRPSNEDDRLRLESSGRHFGDPGFYRMLEEDEAHWRIKHLRTLREFFDVYVDEEQTLRCDHRVTFLGMTMLRLHYRMNRQ